MVVLLFCSKSVASICRVRLKSCGRIPFGLVVGDAEDSVLQSWCPSESIFLRTMISAFSFRCFGLFSSKMLLTEQTVSSFQL